MKSIYKIIAPIFFLVIITSGFSKNMEFPITKFATPIILSSSFYTILSLFKKEKLFPYIMGFSIFTLLIISYVKSFLYIEIILGLIIVFIWSLTKKYLNLPYIKDKTN